MTDNEKRFIKSIFSGDSSGHDYYHTIRVYKLATKIAKQENADVKTVRFCYMMWTILSFLRTLMLPRKMQLIL